MSAPEHRREVLERALVELREARARAAHLERRDREPIALVGIGCRFPGCVDGPHAFWDLLRDGREAVREVPPERWDLDAYYDPDPDAPGKAYTRRGAFIDDVDGFDALLFGIPPREAASMDPQHRLVLEVAWAALEHAGIAPDSMRGSRTGVWVGLTAADYAHLAAKVGDPAKIDAYLGTGNAPNFAAGRLSYLLGLEGPSITLDTACSSSLVTVHLACASLRSGECDIALAGGVNLMLLPETTVALAKARMLSAAGRCRTFDAAADGYVRGEGCGVVVLKRLSDAEAAGDQVLAIVRGSAVNQDGRSSGATVPYAAAQEAVVRAALEAAGIAPAEVVYVEAHGTGTPLGDPIELRALGRSLGAGREQPALIGSVKTNIGHLEAAAGVAGLIKAALTVQHGEVPPHLHLERPNPHVDWSALPLRVVTETTPLNGGRRVAGVSSFGISGTNAHVVIEGPPAPVPEAPTTESGRPVIVKLAARGERALAASAARLREFVAAAPDGELGALARAACTGRADLPDRAAIVAATREELRERLEAIASGGDAPGAWRGRAAAGSRPKTAFLVAGQGSRYGGALRTLHRREPCVARALDELAEVLGPLDRPPLAALLEPGSDADRALDRTEIAQPALYALALALGAWWGNAGVRPDAVVGHSVGAYAAAALAGVFSAQDGARIVAERGRAMATLPAGGAMAAVLASRSALTAALDGHPEVVVACLNGPRETVVAGREQSVEALCSDLARNGVRTRRLGVSHAFHSPLVEPALPALERALDARVLRTPLTTLVSDTTGADAGAEAASPAYWLRHAREPVDFAAALATLGALGCRQLIELGPATTLLALARRHPATEGAAVLASRDPEASLAQAWIAGTAVDWRSVGPPASRRPRLPTYPFQRRRHWLPPAAPDRDSGPPAPPGLVPRRIETPLADDLYRADLTIDSARVLAEHSVYGHAVVPGVAYLELIIAAAERSGVSDPAIHELALRAPLTVADGERRELQIVVEPAVDGGRRVHVHSRHDGDWRRQADAVVRPGVELPAAGREPLEPILERCAEELSGAAFYDEIWHPSFVLGPSFRLIERIRRRDGEALALLRVPTSSNAGPRPDLLALDACVQALVATLPRGAADDVERPLALGTGHASFRAYRATTPDRLWCWATLDEGDRGELTGDVRVLDELGDPIADVGGIGFRRIRGETLRRLAGADGGAPPPRPRAPELGASLRAASPAERPTLVLDHVARELAAVAGMPAAELDLDQPVVSLADSLMLAELKTRLEADLGLEIPVEALFDQPQLSDLAGWLAGRLTPEADGRAGPRTMAVDELRAEAQLDPAIAPHGRRSASGRPRAVLLTGATGFVGAFLLDELLARTRAPVYCLVRAASAAAGLDRIRVNLRAYGLDPPGLDERVVPVSGDLERPLLGLERPAFDDLAARIDAVHHCGALVKWTYPYSALAAANVEGTREVLRLASAGRPSAVHFVSTVGVFSSAAFAGAVVAEDDDLERSGPLAVGYAQSKWIAERMVRTAAARGLPMTVHRPSIGPHSRSGAFNAHDHVALAVRGCVQLGAAPDSELPVQIAPVDFVGRAVVHLSLSEQSTGGTFHLVNRDVLTWTELFDAVGELGYPLARLPFDEWRAALAEQVGEASNALAGLLPFLDDTLERSRLPVFDCRRTHAALERAGIACPRLDLDYLRTCIDGFVTSGFLEPAREPLEG